MRNPYQGYGQYGPEFTLVQGNEFKCPHCNTGLDVDRLPTDNYEGELEGDFDIHCIGCDKEFRLGIRVIPEYKVSLDTYNVQLQKIRR